MPPIQIRMPIISSVGGAAHRDARNRTAGLSPETPTMINFTIKDHCGENSPYGRCLPFAVAVCCLLFAVAVCCSCLLGRPLCLLAVCCSCMLYAVCCSCLPFAVCRLPFAHVPCLLLPVRFCIPTSSFILIYLHSLPI